MSRDDLVILEIDAGRQTFRDRLKFINGCEPNNESASSGPWIEVDLYREAAALAEYPLGSCEVT